MPTNIKLVALDMDGTTNVNLGDIVPSNIEPIKQAQELGVKVVFVTGRPVFAPHNKIKENRFDKYDAIIAACNGAMIYDFQKQEILNQSPIDGELVKQAFELLKVKGNEEVDLFAYTSDFDLVYVNKTLEESKWLKLEKPFFNGKYEVINENSNPISCQKILLFNPNEDIVNQYKHIGLEVAWTPGHIAAEVNANGINKAYAVKWLVEHFNVNMEDVMAMGDGANDLPMMQIVGLPVAPSNATQSVKDVSKVVLELDNVQGAVGYSIKKYVLGEGQYES